MTPASAVSIALALVLSPLLLGVINRTKALFGGRTGQPLLQHYYDIAKCLQKGAVYSSATTWFFRAGPIVALAATLTALSVMPFGPVSSVMPFAGDFILLAGLLGLARFVMVAAALDTGSAFEGMGASREVMIGLVAEPALVLGFAAVAAVAGSASLSGMAAGTGLSGWLAASPVLVLATVALFGLMLAENARIPVDDPNTHLELTMVHEVMALDHSGPDFACILYASALKLWIFGALLLGFVLPLGGVNQWWGLGLMAAGMVLLAVAIGVVESVLARLRMSRLPLFLGGAVALSVFALMIAYR